MLGAVVDGKGYIVLSSLLRGEGGERERKEERYCKN